VVGEGQEEEEEEEGQGELKGGNKEEGGLQAH
jgi:hypothetical protein